jgi:chaperonin GroEL
MSEIQHGMEARDSLLSGIEAVGRTVKGTLGPKARTVVYNSQNGAPIVINDGVSIVSQITLDDPFENMGASLIKQVAQEAQAASGDGTTSAITIGLRLAANGLKRVKSGECPVKLKQELDSTVKKVVETIREGSWEVDEGNLLDVATIASNNDPELGQVISEAFDMVGEHGIIVVEEANSPTADLSLSEGMKIDSGPASEHFLGGQREIRLNDALIVCTDETINDFNEIIPALDIASSQKRPLVLICASIGPVALQNYLLNVIQGRFEGVVVTLPGHGKDKSSIMADIACKVGAEPLISETGARVQQISELEVGSSDVILRESQTVFIPDEDYPEVSDRIEALKEQIEKAEHQWDAQTISNRVARLKGKVATIKIGSTTQTESFERKARIDDAVNATRAALQGGVVVGGGLSLYNCIPSGSDLVDEGLKAVIFQLAENAGIDDEDFAHSLDYNRTFHENDPHIGYNAASDSWENLQEAGVLDPCIVVCNSLEAAASIAGLVLTTDSIVVNEHE